MTEPTDSPSSSDDFDDDLPSPEALARHRRMRMLVTGLVLLAVVGVAAFVIYRLVTAVELEPDKVVVVIDAVDAEGTTHAWWGSDPEGISQAWSTVLGEELSVLGLKVVRLDGEAREALAGARDAQALREAARKLGASYVVYGTLRTARSMPWSSTDVEGFVQELTLQIIDADDAAGQVEVFTTPVRMIAVGRSEVLALKNQAGRDALFTVLPYLAEALVARPGLQRLQSDSGSLDDKKIAVSLEKRLFLYVEDWKRKLGARQSDVKKAEAALTSDEQSPNRRHVLSEFVAQEDVVGVVGERVLLLDEMIELGFDWPPGEIVGDTTIERLILADARGGQRQVVLEHDNFYSQPSVSTNGRFATFVLSQGRSRTLARLDLEDESGGFLGLRTTTGGYFSSPVITDDGRFVAVQTYRQQRGPHALEVVDVESSQHVVLLPAGTRFSQPSWVPRSHTFYLSARLADDDDVMSVYRYDAASNTLTPVLGAAAETTAVTAEEDGAETPPTALEGSGADASALLAPPDADDADVVGEPLTVRVPSDYRSVVVSPTGEFAIVIERAEGGTFIGRLELADHRYQRLRALDVAYVQISPDGRWLAMQIERHGASRDPARGDSEIAVLALPPAGAPDDGGALVMLTLNSADDYLRSWSADSRAVYATQYSIDPTWGRRRLLSRVFRIELGAE